MRTGNGQTRLTAMPRLRGNAMQEQGAAGDGLKVLVRLGKTQKNSWALLAQLIADKLYWSTRAF